MKKYPKKKPGGQRQLLRNKIRETPFLAGKDHFRVCEHAVIRWLNLGHAYMIPIKSRPPGYTKYISFFVIY